MLATHVERHGPERRALGRDPPAIGHQELLTGAHINNRAMEDTAERTEQVITVRGGRPLDRVDAKRHGRDHRPHGLPPHGQRGMIKKTCKDVGRLRRDEQALLKSSGGIRGGNGHAKKRDPDYFCLNVCTCATTAQTCSFVISSEKTGIFGFWRPFQIL